MVAGHARGPQQTVFGGVAGGEGQADGAALDSGEAFLQRLAGRVGAAGVLVAAAQAADAVLLVDGDLVDRRDDGSGQRVRSLAGAVVPAGALAAPALAAVIDTRSGARLRGPDSPQVAGKEGL